MSSARRHAFGMLLRAHRKAAQLTQEELAERAGISARSITNLERGVPHGPRKDTIELLANALRLTVDQRTEFFAVAHAIQRGVLPLAHALPIPATTLIGREEDVRAVADLLDRGQTRLLTFCGPPGVGKTRLALEVVRRREHYFSDGGVFVSLAPLTDPALVEVAVTHALGITGKPGAGSPREQLIAALGGKHLLLLLDNFEHLLSAAPVVSELLAAAPGVSIIATSRAPLRTQGEQEWPVAPLALPDVTPQPRSSEALAHVPAVALFIERARAVRPAWIPTSADIESIATICRHLDGLPLAIELAAAHIRVFSPPALLALLNRRQSLPDAAARDVPARQRTLHDAMMWSYRLLSSEAQALFRKLAVFPGSFSLHAAVAICGEQTPMKEDALSTADAFLIPIPTDGPTAGAVGRHANLARVSTVPPTILEGLSMLVEHHLLHVVESIESVESSGDTSRFLLLATIREFAAEQLATQGEGESAYACHAGYYTRLAESAAPRLKGVGQAAWLERLDAESDNLRASLQWALDAGQFEMGGRLAAALWRFWDMRGLGTEGCHWIERLLAAQRGAILLERAADVRDGGSDHADHAGDLGPSAPMSAVVEGQLYNAAGVLAMRGGDLARAREQLERGLALRRAQGDLPLVAASLNNLALVAMEAGTYRRAAALYEECLSIQRTLDHPRAIASTLNNRGMLARYLGEYTQAQTLYEEGIALYRAAGDRCGFASALGNLAIVEKDRGRYDHARTLYEEALDVQRSLGDSQGIAISLNNLAELLTYLGDYEQAQAHCMEALALVDELDNQRLHAAMLVELANAVRGQGHLDRAQALYSEALTVNRTLHHERGTAETLLELGHLACIEERWDDAKAQYYESIETTRNDEAPRHASLCLEGLACAICHAQATRRGDIWLAARLGGAAEQLREEMGIAQSPLQSALHERTVARLRVRLGEQRFIQAWSRGRADGAKAHNGNGTHSLLTIARAGTALEHRHVLIARSV